MMEEKGLFRSAIGGFQKKDVLDYIDRITAEWDTERQELQADKAAALAENDALKAQIEELREAADEAAQKTAQVEETLEEIRQQAKNALAETRQQAEDDMAEAQRQIEALQEILVKKDELANVAAEQAADTEKRLAACEAALADRDERLTEMQRQQEQYQTLLGDCNTIRERVDNVVMPYMQRTVQQADTAIDAVHAGLDAVTAQIEQLRRELEEQRQALRQEETDSESALEDTAAQWLKAARQLAQPGIEAANAAEDTPIITAEDIPVVAEDIPVITLEDIPADESFFR